ncbi:MAG: hypothetical protein R2795_01825 [Saprospiraceae bacterium]
MLEWLDQLPAAEVWFSFTATANQTSVTVSGLMQPNVVIFSGNNCVSLLAINCGSGNGTVTVTSNTFIGDTYYILVSEDLNDTRNFNMSITSRNLCDSCAPPYMLLK